MKTAISIIGALVLFAWFAVPSKVDLRAGDPMQPDRTIAVTETVISGTGVVTSLGTAGTNLSPICDAGSGGCTGSTFMSSSTTISTPSNGVCGYEAGWHAIGRRCQL